MAKSVKAPRQEMLTREIFLAAKMLDDESKKRGGGPIDKRKISEALCVTAAVAKDIITLLTYGKFLGAVEGCTAPAKKALIISDIHIPYHDSEALEVALQAGEKAKVDTVVLLGDVLDFYKISSFSKDPRRKSVNLEMSEGRAFLEQLRARFPKSPISFYRGNHEARLEKYICSNAVELVDMLDGIMQNKLGFHELGIEYHTEPYRLGRLWLMHGHEKPGGFGAEHIPNVMWKYVHDHCLVGHFHRRQEKIFKKISNERFWVGALGSLCGPQDYALLNQWSQGYAIIDFDANGRFHPHLFEIVEGQSY
jgi:predicted phosphodiesterase